MHQVYKSHLKKYQNNTGKPAFHKNSLGFTLIELLVVISIIGLLASVALVALSSARQKGRDVTRLSDMAQMNTGLELYYSAYGGYPSTTSLLVPNYTASLPYSPQPPDGNCLNITYPAPVPAGNTGSQYYYYASGTAVLGSDKLTMVYPDFAYYFCLGATTGIYAPGMHILTPEAVR